MAHTLVNPLGRKALEVPSWLSLDTIVQSARKLYQHLKLAFDKIPTYQQTIDPLDYNSDTDRDEKERQGKRRWIARQHLHFATFFRNYNSLKQQASLTTTARSSSKLSQRGLARPSTQLESGMRSSGAEPSHLSQSEAVDTVEDDMLLST